ncbi:hypothetical protein [Thalassospira aquimaris]|uniref:hypothetical protein n=1 Tax=Thalassospira aquimaris TaxID=3037796 RepID=UPI002414591F|nr:hypothetical protein [Thalassospira sp. FZY0004]
MALSLYLEKNRTKKQFVFENFSHIFRQTAVPKQNYHAVIAAKIADFPAARELQHYREE